MVFRNGKAARRERLWAGYPADVRAGVQADVLCQKLSPHHAERRNKVFGADVHDSAPASEKCYARNFGLIFRSLKKVLTA